MRKTKQIGPLTDADYQELNRQLSDIARKREECITGVTAGCPLEPYIVTLDATKERLEKIKQAYFPDRP